MAYEELTLITTLHSTTSTEIGTLSASLIIRTIGNHSSHGLLSIALSLMLVPSGVRKSVDE